jgi:hypothetical protein
MGVKKTVFSKGKRPVPILETRASYIQDTAAASHNVTLPSGIVSGELLLMFVMDRATLAVVQPSGWNAISVGGAAHRCFWKIADNNDGGTQTITISGGTSRVVARTFRISGASTANGTGNGSSINPPSHTATKTFRNNLWFATMYSNRSDWSVSGTPSGYTVDATVQNTSGATNQYCGLSVCYLIDPPVDTQNPSTYSVTGSTNTPRSITVCVQP